MLQRNVLDDKCAMPMFSRALTTREPMTLSDGDRRHPNIEQHPSGLPQESSSVNQQFSAKDPCMMLDVMKARIGDGERPPPYLPQPEDVMPVKSEGPMGPIGPWATGRPTCRPLGGMTGLRPVGDRYSITRYSPGEWRALNENVLKQSDAAVQDVLTSTRNAKDSLSRVIKETDQKQQDNTEKLKSRAAIVFKWKNELEQAITMMIEEIELLETERRRVKQSLSVLTMPESIAGEFLQLRSTRLDPDLVRDSVNDELIKEVALCTEIRELLVRTREQIETQSVELKTAKTRMEFDWTDKTEAFEIETQCIGLANDSPLIMWKPGATRFPAEQSTTDGYDHVTREALAEAETARQRSTTLRSTLDAIYVNAIRDLRVQADRVDAALAEKISVTELCCQRLENELLRCLFEIANIEGTIENLRESTRKLDNALKVVQTRLANRLNRRNVENCRDEPQYSLLEEAKKLSENIATMTDELRKAEESQRKLVKARGDLERQIIIKKKSLYIDRDRGQWLRSFYPSATDLSGHV